MRYSESRARCISRASLHLSCSGEVQYLTLSFVVGKQREPPTPYMTVRSQQAPISDRVCCNDAAYFCHHRKVQFGRMVLELLLGSRHRRSAWTPVQCSTYVVLSFPVSIHEHCHCGRRIFVSHFRRIGQVCPALLLTVMISFSCTDTRHRE